MIRAIRGLAMGGLVASAAAVGMVYVYAQIGGWPSTGDIAWHLPQFAAETGRLVSFSAGVLVLAQTVQKTQRPWTAALLASLILNGYWALALQVLLAKPEPIVGISYWLAPAAPALVALAYTVRAARSAPQATPAGEDGNLDIRIEPIGTEQR